MLDTIFYTRIDPFADIKKKNYVTNIINSFFKEEENKDKRERLQKENTLKKF